MTHPTTDTQPQPTPPATPLDDTAQKEAAEFWGFLVKSDRTGTDKFKNLLRGLHAVIVRWSSALCLRC